MAPCGGNGLAELSANLGPLCRRVHQAILSRPSSCAALLSLLPGGALLGGQAANGPAVPRLAMQVRHVDEARPPSPSRPKHSTTALRYCLSQETETGRDCGAAVPSVLGAELPSGAEPTANAAGLMAMDLVQLSVL